jgi:FixJ family two-component response regulator
MGRALGQRLRDRFPSLPVLYISAYPADDLFHRGAPASDAPFLQKPVSETELLKAVERLLAPGGIPGNRTKNVGLTSP